MVWWALGYFFIFNVVLGLLGDAVRGAFKALIGALWRFIADRCLGRRDRRKRFV